MLLSLAVHKGILALEMRPFGRVALFVSRAQISPYKVAVASWKIAVVYLFRRVVQLMPIQVLGARVGLATAGLWALVLLVRDLDDPSLFL